jgi:hypothetical protein
MSQLRDALDNYLAIRRALGYKLERPGLLLADFVAHLEAKGSDTITTDAALTWATLPPNGASDWWAQRLSWCEASLVTLTPSIPPTRSLRPACCPAGAIGLRPTCTPMPTSPR